MSVQTIQSELFVELSALQQELLSGGQRMDEGPSGGEQPGGEFGGEGGQFGGEGAPGGETYGGRRRCPPYYYCGGRYYYPYRRHGGRY